ncbi:MAG: cell wall hydrolase [Sphingobium sp.]
MSDNEDIRPGAALLWLAIIAGVPALVATWDGGKRVPALVGATAGIRSPETARPADPPPPVAPVELLALDQQQAREVNSALPFSTLPNPAARPFAFAGSATDLARATDCLAAAQLYEAGDDAVGQKAVAQVVLNRVRHPAFPKTVCGVVFQGQERATGCQFTFTCDGALARTPGSAAWSRARTIAQAALAGAVYAPVGYATHYHTDWVVPYWSSSLDKITAVGTHLFFRWKGWWGTPPAFRGPRATGEPIISRIARFAAAHQDAPSLASDSGLPVLPGKDDALARFADLPARTIDTASVGKRFGSGRLVAIEPGGKSFLVELAARTSPDSWTDIAQAMCAGRPVCRVMAWPAGTTPVAFPLNQLHLDRMAFAYIQNAAIGLRRALWNCQATPRAARNECMAQRIPLPVRPPTGMEAAASRKSLSTLDGVRRRERFETVKIVPPAPSPPAEQPPIP